ncbi:MAG: tetratricopeptide repeat protein [Planctomycetes bacterium]|nr:tetratricopeptide repeat protein [Planctomycetota bacterium]
MSDGEPQETAAEAPAPPKPSRVRQRVALFVVLGAFAVFGGIAWWRANSFSHQLERGAELMGEGRYAEAEEHLRRALEIAGRGRGAEHERPQANWALARLCLERERLAEAESFARKSLEEYEALGAKEADPLLWPLDVLCRAQGMNGKYAEARESCRRAADLLDRKPGATAEDWADMLDAKGWIEFGAGDYAAADAAFAKALASAERVWPAGDERSLPFLVNCASSRAALGDDGAEREFLARARPIEEKRRTRGDEPEAYLRVCEAERALRLARFDEARERLGPALEILRKQETILIPCWASGVEADLLLAAGDRAAAERSLRRVVALEVKAFGRRHPVTTLAVLHLSAFLGTTGRPAEAEAGCREVLDALHAFRCDEHPNAAWAQHVLAEALLDQRKDADAAAAVAQALAIRRKRLGDRHPFTGLTLALAARIFTRARRAGEAASAATEALAIIEAAVGDAHPARAAAEAGAAEVDLAAGRADAAETRWRRALGILETVYGKDHLFAAGILEGLARAVRAAGDPQQEAASLEARAKAIRAK